MNDGLACVDVACEEAEGMVSVDPSACFLWFRAVGIGEGEEYTMRIAVSALLLVSACAGEMPLFGPLEHYAQHLDRYDIYVWEGGGWLLVEDRTDDALTLVTGMQLDISTLDAWVAAYPNGEVIEMGAVRRRLPPGVHFVRSSDPVEHQVLNDSMNEGNAGYVAIEFGAAGAHPEDSNNYSTVLTNTASVPWRVTRFGGYNQVGNNWRLSTITGDLFTAEQFQNWYGHTSNEWVQPGDSVVDYNNYGGSDVAWIYECELEDGTTFRAGAKKPKRSIWSRLFGR